MNLLKRSMREIKRRSWWSSVMNCNNRFSIKLLRIESTYSEDTASTFVLDLTNHSLLIKRNTPARFPSTPPCGVGNDKSVTTQRSHEMCPCTLRGLSGSALVMAFKGDDKVAIVSAWVFNHTNSLEELDWRGGCMTIGRSHSELRRN